MRLKNLLKRIKKLLSIILDDFRFLSFPIAARRLISRLKVSYLSFIGTADYPSRLQDQRFEKLGVQAKRLRAMIQPSKHWSILLDGSLADPISLRTTINSCMTQMLAGDELLIALRKEPSEEFKKVIKITHREASSQSITVKFYLVDRLINALNHLAQFASSEHFLLLEAGCWIRPDLLYRYHQFLLTEKSTPDSIIFCDESKMNAEGNFIPESTLQRPDHWAFPFVFSDFNVGCVSIPKKAWQQMDGLDPKYTQHQLFDLCLRLEHANYVLQGIPLNLVARLDNDFNLEQVSTDGPEIMRKYFGSKGYKLDFCKGLHANNFRPLIGTPADTGVVVIVPFHNQVEMTVKCLARLREIKSENKIHIVAVNNRSTEDTSAIRALSDEYLDADFTFNYSKINNLASRNCNAPREEYPLILFLNNDVVLNKGALKELVSWMWFENVGIVGARLFYPDGSIQHGGIYIDRSSSKSESRWRYLDFKHTKNPKNISAAILATDAVTTACALMRRNDFEKIGGFDEIQYPIAYSDTDLCARIRTELKKVCILTPYADGTHYESISRGKGGIKDYESSGWLSYQQNTQVDTVTPRIL